LPWSEVFVSWIAKPSGTGSYICRRSSELKRAPSSLIEFGEPTSGSLTVDSLAERLNATWPT
jgi:hypothetical protein